MGWITYMQRKYEHRNTGESFPCMIDNWGSLKLKTRQCRIWSIPEICERNYCKPVKLRLHQIHVAGYKYPGWATCIRNKDTSGYNLYQATCIRCKRGITLTQTVYWASLRSIWFSLNIGKRKWDIFEWFCKFLTLWFCEWTRSEVYCDLEDT